MEIARNTLSLITGASKCKCYCSNNCDGNFFRSVGKEWQKKAKKTGVYYKSRECKWSYF